jgi:hypothetical protein
MAKYPDQLSQEVRSLSEVVEQSQLNKRGLFVVEGLNILLAEQLVEASKQPHIGEYCLNDPTKRFGSLEKVIAWQSKGRLALPLVRKAGDGALLLAGFGWMGPSKPDEDEPTIPGATTTFAIRIYENAVGQGNALPYTKAIVQANDVLYGNEGVWLEAWGDNTAALKTYEKGGFKKVAEMLGSRHGESLPRVYMTLGELAANQ